MLHRLRAIVLVTFALISASCSSPTITPGPFAPSLLKAGSGAARGSIVWIKKVTVFRKAALSGEHTTGTLGFAEQVVSQLGGTPKCDVALYAILYNTAGVSGEAATASAAFFVPSGCKGPFTLIGYGQGTNVVEAQKITRPTKTNIEPQLQAAIFASHGYAMTATDYLGLGYSNYPFEPYLVVNAEASAVIDSMRAARIAAGRLHVALSGDVFLTGYSQGGQTSLGTQKIIEAQNAGEFHLIADSPSSGPYALTRTLLDGLRDQGQNAAVLSTFLLTAYNKTYANVYTNATSVFRDPYASYVTNLLPVKTYARAAKLQGQLLPRKVSRLLRTSFTDGFATDGSSPARQDVAANDLLDDWTPKAPVYFCGGKRDPQVEFENAIAAYHYFKARGANVSLLDVDPDMPSSVPLSEYHDAALVLCHTLERVAVLDSRRGRARAGRWPAWLHGRMGPFTHPSLLP